MTMQRRHFELIAETLKNTRETIQGEQHKVIHDLYAKAFAQALRSTNPQFNRERFLKACGVDQ